MSIRDQVQMFAESSEFFDDRVNYMDCPECGRHKKLLVVTTDDGGLFWRCFAASCAIQGGGNDKRTKREKRAKIRTVAPRLPTRYLTDDNADELRAHVPAFAGVSSADLACVRISMTSGAFVYPITSIGGTTRGVVERWYDGRRPKTKTHLYEADGPLLGWFRNVYSSTVIIVEDLASALAVSLHTRCTGVALCGTSLSSEGANELRGRGYNARTLICLDRDATERAADLRQKWAAVIGGTVRVVPLRKDIKDMRPADIKFW